jgi:O-antigen/teichoic acid export membrane protein
MIRERTLLSNTFILGIGNILPKVATFLILPLLTALLTKEEYGTYDLVLTSTSFVIPIFTLLIEHGVFRFLIESDNWRKKSKIITNSIIFITISSSLLFIFSYFILMLFDVQHSLLICLFIVIQLYYNYSLQLCRGLKILRIYSITSITNAFINIALILLFVYQVRLGLTGLLISLIISLSVATIFALTKCNLKNAFSLNYFDKKEIIKLLNYSIPLLPNTLSWWVINVSDRWLIAMFLNVEMVAIYAISTKFPSLLNLFYNNFNLAWQESASSSLEDEDIDEYYTKIFRNLFDFLIGSLLVLITSSPFLFSIFINEDYFLSYYQMPILYISVFLNCIAAYYGGIYVAYKKTKSISLTSLLAAGVNIVTNLVLINFIGIYAASISSLVSFLVLALYRASDVQKYVNIEYRYKRIIILFLLVCSISGVSYINDFYLNIINFIFAVTIAIKININIFKVLVAKIR